SWKIIDVTKDLKLKFRSEDEKNDEFDYKILQEALNSYAAVIEYEKKRHTENYDRSQMMEKN
nr:hypothetical protein [Tanacetum cinerariifolium]